MDERSSLQRNNSPSCYKMSSVVEALDNFDLLKTSGSNEITEEQFVQSIETLQEALRTNRPQALAHLRRILDILNCRPLLVSKYWPAVFHPDHSQLFATMTACERETTGSELFMAAIPYLNTFLDGFVDRELKASEVQFCKAVGEVILHFHFKAAAWARLIETDTFLKYSLKVLYKVMICHQQFVQENTAELLGLGKSYLCYGLVANDKIGRPQKVPPSQQTLSDLTTDCNEPDTPARSHGGKLSKTRKPRVKKPAAHQDLSLSDKLGPEASNDWRLWRLDTRTSDSEASGAEGGAPNAANKRHLHSKVRLTAISIIGLVTAAQERHALYGYWYALLPSSSVEAAADNLLHSAWRDPNVRCRCTVLQIIAHLTYGSRRFLEQAEYPMAGNQQLPFMPFSLSLGITVLNSYDLLGKVLTAESSNLVLLQALKCFAVLVQATNFKRFPAAVIGKLVAEVRPFVAHRDTAIQVSALMVFEFFLLSADVCDAIKTAVGLTDSLDGPRAEDGASEDSCWLLRCVFDNIAGESVSATPLVIESLQILATMSGQLHLLHSGEIQKVANIIRKTLNDAAGEVRVYAARCLDSWSLQIASLLAKKPDCKRFDRFWDDTIPVVIGQFALEPPPGGAIKVLLCDALANISPVVFERMPFAKQMNLLSFLSGISGDSAEERLVQSAAVRALAMLANFPSLKENMVFLENVAELTLRLSNDSNLVIRVKLFWSLANVSDALINADSKESVSQDLLRRLVTVCLATASDNDKIRCNSVRALGNLLRLYQKEQLLSRPEGAAQFQAIISTLVDSLKSPGNAKVKWNLCYAICNIMKHPQCLQFQWQDSLYPTLCNMIVHHSNFKVRINATAVVLAGDRQHYGQHFESIWLALLGSLEESVNIQNFYEYNHRDNLQEQLCLTISHCIGCAAIEDFPMLRRCLAAKVETVQYIWMRVINRIVPEKAASLVACGQMLGAKLNSGRTISAAEQSAITFLRDTFSLAAA